ncbi:ABC transporter substrate-binding protein [Shimia sp. R10_1]|uniref:ABC transporter substrate-binding protein n=1 Tax=Shimia sp. R10_1 TaxID=2821095 RepID=UPI001ADA42C6|nr:ABC transporter substrate-binding protein [Shimia sp. R10_1]MBO9475698.1 ABC transporter substrate-binding protein [Shimia sp. R10_1]
MRLTHLISMLAVLLLGGAAQAQEAADPLSVPPSSEFPAHPQRVVSMNLCTDQLAMMLAAPGQLLSVSYLALDSRSSAMVEEARAYEINHGRAEEIYLLEPDLVIAGAYTTRATVDMLRRLDVPVAVIQPARALDDVVARILKMGTLLGHEDSAEAMAAQFIGDLSALTEANEEGPRAALYSANGWTSGDKSLAGQILRAAGLRNVATEKGFSQGGILPLEVLVMAAPDMVINSGDYPGHSRAEDVLRHPVLDVYRAPGMRSDMRDRDWVCGTPYVLRAIKRLRNDRDQFQRTAE